MIYLQSKDIFLQVAILNPATCKYKIINKSTSEIQLPKILQGVYSFLGNKFVALYVDNKKLFLCINKKKYLIDKNYSISISNDLDKKTFILKQSNKVIEQFHYLKEELFDDSVTPFIDEEDGDYGLFIANLINNENKKNRFISNRL